MPDFIPIYQVDAFADAPFTGNPAAVCPFPNAASWPSDSVLQAIAAENNLSETAFFKPCSEGYDLRWFTPKTEVELCGHATLATAHILYSELDETKESIRFKTRSGLLTVTRTAGGMTMDFPATPLPRCDDPAIIDQLARALGQRPEAWYAGIDGMAVFKNADQIASMTPDMTAIASLPIRGLIVTAPGSSDSGYDFVSRFFAPGVGVAEDPVTGSAHCRSAPYWADRLGKTQLTARQMSPRGGTITCTVKSDRVLLTGRAMTFMRGMIALPADLLETATP